MSNNDFILKEHLKEKEPIFYHNVDKQGRQVTVCILKSRSEYLPSLPYKFDNKRAKCVTRVIANSKKERRELLEWYQGWEDLVIKATVTCLEEDTYDEKLGEKLALAKARYKMYIKWMNIIGNVLGPHLLYINKVLGVCNMDLYKRYAAEKNYFNKLKDKQDETSS